MVSPDEFRIRMHEACFVRMHEARFGDDDPEEAHVRADELMCKVLKEMGYGAGVSVFEDMKKEYA